jgi:STE24 endopeptidase
LFPFSGRFYGKRDGAKRRTRAAMKDAGAYSRKKRQLRNISLIIQPAFLLLFSLFCAAPLREGAENALNSWPGQRILFLFVFFACWRAALWPLTFLSGWKLEKEFGMSRQTFSGWLSDQAKAQALGLVFFISSALIFFAAVEMAPAHAWWLLACIGFGFSALVSTVFPVLILPMFHKSAPLQNKELAGRLQTTLERCGLPRLPLHEIKLGQKTSRANAMLTGFGATRRALLSDTLISAYEPAEIEMVLAHEAGHDVRRHLLRSLLFEAAAATAGFYMLFALFETHTILDPAFFPTISLISFLAGLISMPLANGLSRAHEREADRFALGIYPDAAIFASLMKKLSEQNLADPSPGRFEEFFFYTHPSKARRIAAGEKYLASLLANRL